MNAARVLMFLPMSVVPVAAGAHPAEPPPCVPVAVNDFYEVAAGGVLLAQVTSNDPETCDFAIIVFDEPDHAQGLGFVFDQSSGAFVYEPDPGFVGADSFLYGIGVTDPVFATATINVVAAPTTTSSTTTTTVVPATTTTEVSTTTVVATGSTTPSTTTGSPPPTPTTRSPGAPTTVAPVPPSTPPPSGAGPAVVLPATR